MTVSEYVDKFPNNPLRASMGLVDNYQVGMFEPSKQRPLHRVSDYEVAFVKITDTDYRVLKDRFGIFIEDSYDHKTLTMIFELVSMKTHMNFTMVWC
jgi:hypothetical protein